MRAPRLTWVLAHATAFELERAGGTVALCALIDSVLPGERPELLGRVMYRLGAVLGPLAGALAGEDEADLVALLELPAGERLERATQIARRRGDAVADLPREALERELAVAAVHATALAEHSPAIVEAPLRVIWAEQTLAGGVPLTDWARYTRGGFEQSAIRARTTTASSRRRTSRRSACTSGSGWARPRDSRRAGGCWRSLRP